MQNHITSSSTNSQSKVSLSPAEMAHVINQQGVKISRQEREIIDLRRQIVWFQRQIFGQKSERRMPEPESEQGILGEGFTTNPNDTGADSKTVVAGHTRQAKRSMPDSADESSLFFDEAKVPVQVIQVANPEIDGLAASDYEIIGEKISYRLAQRPGSYVVLKYVRPVIKRADTQTITCPTAPVGIVDGSRADVSFIAGMIVDKFAYHQPLYRQHTRLIDSGIKVSRAWLTKLMPQAVALLEPIHAAQLESIRSSRVISMDETPIKAGRAGPGKMKSAYIWPVYGEQDEICFLYYPSRSARHVQETLGTQTHPQRVLQTDGYAAYEQYTRRMGLSHAQCWAHARRKVYDAQDMEPEAAAIALDWIGALYAVETHIREQNLAGPAKKAYRQTHARPIANQLFAWIETQFDNRGFLPSSPLLGALGYIRDRRPGLEIYLDDPDVSIDTNHLERALRVIPMGRKNWLFSWTELGAKHIGIVQSLLVTCRLYDINPYDYLVDVLQRIGQHPASKVHELTPRLWRQQFAANPLRSDLHSAA